MICSLNRLLNIICSHTFLVAAILYTMYSGPKVVLFLNEAAQSATWTDQLTETIHLIESYNFPLIVFSSCHFETYSTTAIFQTSLIRYLPELVPNYVSQLNSPHLNAVAPQWPLRRSEPLISLALILLYWFLPPYKLCLSLLEPTVSFCTATIKITGQWNIPPEGVGGGFWNNFQLCPSFLKHPFSLLCCCNAIGYFLKNSSKYMAKITHFGCYWVTLQLRSFAKSCIIVCQHIICIPLHYTLLNLRNLVIVTQQNQCQPRHKNIHSFIPKNKFMFAALLEFIFLKASDRGVFWFRYRFASSET